MTALAAVLAGVALLLLLRPGTRPVDRLGRVAARPVTAGPPDPGPPLPDAARSAAACALAAAALVLLLGGAVGLVLGAATALLGPRALRRLEPAAVCEERRRLEADLPLALDLLAACLAGGATLAGASTAVGAAVGGPIGQRLARVSGALAVGGPAEEAWAGLAVDPDDPLAPVARALSRSARSGAPVAVAVVRVADEARAAARGRGEKAARRAGVLAVGPLAVCFLPAFVLVGVVPVVVGLVAPLLASL
ncbi:MAG: type II secretion system F family protein [Mycobacteriales bacterium]|nr:type II secretion system F family protein [Mycobacteriales bacterium]